MDRSRGLHPEWDQEAMNEREAFEAWYEAYCMPSEADWFRLDADDENEYHHAITADAWAAWQARAAIEADRAQRVPDGWKLEAAVAIDELLRLIRRNAPELSGKVLGNAQRVLDTALAPTPAPAQQEPAKPMDAHLAAYFMRRFLHEEKMLGPNEQAALQFTIAALEALESAQHQAQPQQERKPMTHIKEQARSYQVAQLAPTTGMVAISSAAYIELYERHHGIKE